jgi:hypothetical protein
MARNRTTQLQKVMVVAALGLLFPALAQALPNYAQQTGQPCTACHIGAYGPQLTAFGRAFKIGGYTQTGGDEGTPIPLSLMLLGSYSNTTKGQGAPAANNYGPNGNFAMDQISLFAGGRITDYAGAFVQGTFNGVTSAFHLDNTDLRLTAPFNLGDSDVRLGLDINTARRCKTRSIRHTHGDTPMLRPYWCRFRQPNRCSPAA